MPAFYKEIKKNSITATDIKYILATHYHPDHMGLISKLTELGVKLLLMKHQITSVHYSDAIFKHKPQLGYKPIDQSKASIISCEESRAFLYNIGINGEIIPTISHSDDGIAVIWDDVTVTLMKKGCDNHIHNRLSAFARIA